MTDRSSFSDDQWHAITDAPVAILLASTLVGDHGPISLIKETAAGAKALTRPAPSGPADGLLLLIAADADEKQARHDAKQHKGGSPEVVVTGLVGDVEQAVAALGGIPAEESAQVKRWFYDIGSSVAEAAKGVKPAEQDFLERLATALGITP